jgi:hypothetical protein
MAFFLFFSHTAEGFCPSELQVLPIPQLHILLSITFISTVHFQKIVRNLSKHHARGVGNALMGLKKSEISAFQVK